MHSSHLTSPQSRIHRRPRTRGVAMIMVTSAIAAASILAWAMLSTSAVRTQIDANTVDSLDAASLADSGVSYAMHLLVHPEQVRPANADAATWFYPGQTGLLLWSDARGKVDIAVTSTGADARKIRATATVIRPGEPSGCKQTVEANVTCTYQGIVNAAAFNGSLTLPNNIVITGAVVSKGTVTSPYSNFNNSTPVTASGVNRAPLASDILLLTETGTASTITGSLITDKTYTYNGRTYVAEKAPSTITAAGLTSARPALNPCNVWYSDTNVLLNNASFTGVLVMRGTAIVTAAGTCTLRAPADMPALIAAKNIEMKSTSIIPAKLYVTGAVWLGEKMTSLVPNRSDAVVKIDGALINADLSPQFQLSAQVTITYKASVVATVSRLTAAKTLSGIQVSAWKKRRLSPAAPLLSGMSFEAGPK